METSGDFDQPRREWLVVLALTVVAAIPRLWGLGSEGLTHFDEGLYAFAGLWSVNPREVDGIGAMVVPYAPPGFPFLVGLAYSVLGVSDTSILLVSAACGVLTVPVAAWVGRRTFGPGAGASTAAFAALSMAHIAFSRKGLTDSPFLLTWLIAIGMGGRFLERPGLFRAIALGLAVGLAQNVKYNGGFAGLIVVVAAVLGALTSRESRSAGFLTRTFGYGLFAAAVSGAFYWPWYRFVETHGGYAALVRHQQSYVGGWRLWPSYCRQQVAQVASLSGGWTWLTIAGTVALLGTALALGVDRRSVSQPSLIVRRYWLFIVINLGWSILFPALGWWIGLAVFVPLARDARPTSRILAAWWLVMSVVTPLYHPYARLWLPLHAAGWVILGGAVPSLLAWREDGSNPRWLSRPNGERSRVSFRFAIALAAISLTQWGTTEPTPFSLRALFAPTDTLRATAHDLRSLVSKPDGPTPTLLLYGRRPLAFYLATLGVPFRLSADAPPASERSWRVIDSAVAGPDGLEGPGLVRQWDSPLDPVTRLDNDPGSAFHAHSHSDAKIGVFHPP